MNFHNLFRLALENSMAFASGLTLTYSFRGVKAGCSFHQAEGDQVAEHDDVFHRKLIHDIPIENYLGLRAEFLIAPPENNNNSNAGQGRDNGIPPHPPWIYPHRRPARHGCTGNG